MAEAIRGHAAEVLNVSVRQSPAGPLALLPWAKEECFRSLSSASSAGTGLREESSNELGAKYL
jgi:hypothetical protein